MTVDDLNRIRMSEGWRQGRVEQFETDDGIVFVKGQRRPRPRIAAWSLRLLARVSGAAELLPVPAPGGALGQQTEVRRLEDLRAAGVRVPRVLHVDPEFFVMERLTGSSLAQHLTSGEPGPVCVWEQGLAFIADVHACGTYLSQATARNLMVTPAGIGAIDFEDDPLAVLTLEQAQVRDWLLYLQSTVWLLRQPRPEQLSVWERHAPSGAVARAMLNAVGALAWMRHLPSRRAVGGRDVISAQAAAALLHDWASCRAR